MPLLAIHLYGQVELLALHDLGPVDVEEVSVEDGLDEAGDDGGGVEEALAGVSEEIRVSICRLSRVSLAI